MASSFDKDVIVSADAFLHVSCYRDEQRAVRQLDIVLALEGMSCAAAGVYLYGGAVHQADVVVRCDAGLVLGVDCIDGKQAVAAEDQLCLAEEDSLMVFVVLLGVSGRCAV